MLLPFPAYVALSRSVWHDLHRFTQPTEIQGPGDIMTHNEAIRARGSSSAPRYVESLASSDAGHQRNGSVPESSRLVQTSDNRKPKPGRLQTSPGSTPEISSEDDHETPLYQPMQTSNAPHTIHAQDIAVLGSRSHTPSTQESLGQRRVNEANAMPSRHFNNSPSQQKRSYKSMSDLSTETTSSSPLPLGVGGTLTVKEEVPSKQRRLVKQESIRTLLTFPQYVPPPPSLISPLRCTR
jgi:hypothetical protein